MLMSAYMVKLSPTPSQPSIQLRTDTLPSMLLADTIPHSMELEASIRPSMQLEGITLPSMELECSIPHSMLLEGISLPSMVVEGTTQPSTVLPGRAGMVT